MNYQKQLFYCYHVAFYRTLRKNVICILNSHGNAIQSVKDCNGEVLSFYDPQSIYLGDFFNWPKQIDLFNEKEVIFKGVQLSEVITSDVCAAFPHVISFNISHIEEKSKPAFIEIKDFWQQYDQRGVGMFDITGKYYCHEPTRFEYNRDFRFDRYTGLRHYLRRDFKIVEDNRWELYNG
jgi:hypothetical protein